MLFAILCVICVSLHHRAYGVKKQIQNTFQPKYYYDDMTSRDVSQLPPIDMYIAGIPCQSWSGLNTKRQGFDVKEGTLFFEALKVIKYHTPKYFIT